MRWLPMIVVVASGCLPLRFPSPSAAQSPRGLYARLGLDRLDLNEKRFAATAPDAQARWHIIADDWLTIARDQFEKMCGLWAEYGEAVEGGMPLALLHRDTGSPMSDETKENLVRLWTWQSCALWRGCVTVGIGMDRGPERGHWRFARCHWNDARTGTVTFPIDYQK